MVSFLKRRKPAAKATGKLRWLRQRLARRLLLCTVALAAASGIAWGAYTYCAAVEDDHRRLIGQIDGLTVEYQALQQQFTQAQDSLLLYQQIMAKNQHDGSALSREQAREKLEQLKRDHYVNDLNLTLSPLQELQGTQYRRKAVLGIANQLQLKFNGVSDVHLIQFAEEMTGELPGFVRLSQLTLMRGDPLTKDALYAIRRQGSFSLVRGEITAIWLGIRNVTP